MFPEDELCYCITAAEWQGKYLCKAADELASQQLDDYEAQEAYKLEYADPLIAIRKNRNVKNSPYNPMMFEREARVLENLIADGLLSC